MAKKNTKKETKTEKKKINDIIKDYNISRDSSGNLTSVTKKTEKQKINEISKNYNFRRDSSGNLTSVTEKTQYKEPSPSDKIKDNYKLTYDDTGTLTNLEFTSKGKQDLLANKVKKGTASEDETLDYDVYRVWNKYKLGDVDEALSPLETEFYNSIKGLKGWKAAEDFDAVRQRGDVLRSKLSEYINYADMYEPDKKQEYVDLYNKYGEAIDQVQARQDYLSQFKDEDEYNGYEYVSGFGTYKDLNQEKGKLRRMKGTGSKELDAEIDKKLGWLDQYGMNSNIISTMSDDDIEYEKNVAKRAKDDYETLYNLYDSPTYLDKLYREKKSQGMSDSQIKQFIANEKASSKSGYDKYNAIGNELNEFGKIRDIVNTENAVTSQSDFEANSKVDNAIINGIKSKSDKGGITSFEQTYYGVNNGGEVARSGHGLPTAMLQTQNTTYSFMSAKQRKVFNYLYNTQGEKAALDYLSGIQNQLNQKYLNAKSVQAYEFGKEHPLLSLGFNALEAVAEGYMSPIKNVASAIKGAGGDINPHSLDNVSHYTHGARVQGGADHYTSNLGKTIYNGANAIGEQLAIMYASKGMGNAFGKGTQIAKKATSIINSTMNSSRIMRDTVLQYKSEGASDFDAVSMGLINGVIEHIVEAIGMETLLKSPDILADAGKLAKTGKYLAKGFTDFTAEGGEELFTGILQSFAAFLTDNREHDEFWSTYDEYVSKGDSQTRAFLHAIKEVAPNYLQDFLAGGIAGGVFGATNTIATVKNYNNIADSASNYFMDVGTDRASVTSFLINMGIEDETELANATNAITKMAKGLSVDSKTEAYVKDNDIYRGVLYGVINANEVNDVNYSEPTNTIDEMKNNIDSVTDSIKNDVPSDVSTLKYEPEKDAKTNLVMDVAEEENQAENPKNIDDTKPTQLNNEVISEPESASPGINNETNLQSETTNTTPTEYIEAKTATANTTETKTSENKSFLADKYQKSLNTIKRSNPNLAIESAGRAGKQVYSSEVTEGNDGLVDSLISDGYSKNEAHKIANRMYTFMYEQGYKGRNMDVAVQAVNDVIVSGYDATAKMFYAAGKIDAGNVMSGKVNAKLIKNNTLKAMQKGGNISYKTVRALNGLASRLGIDIEVVSKIDGGHKASFDTKTGKLLISADVKHKITVSAIHEAVHAVRSVDSKEYNKISNLVYELVSKDTKAYGKAWNLIANQYKAEATGKDGKFNRDLIDEEFTARFLSEILDSKEVINELAKTDRNTLQKIYDAFRYLMDYIGGKYKNEAKGNTEFSDTFALLDSEKASIIKAFNNALGVTESVQSNRVKLSGEKNIANDTDTDYNINILYAKDSQWKPDLPKYKLKRLYEKIKHDAKTSTNNITDTSNWLYTTINGTRVFAIYSNVYGENPTLLYESKDARSEFERDVLLNIKERYSYGTSIDRESGVIDRVSGGSWMRYGHSIRYNTNSVGGRTGSTDAGILPKKSRLKPRPAFKSVLRYLFQRQAETEAEKETKNVMHSSSDEVSDFDDTLVPLPRQSDEEILADAFSLKEEVQKQLDDMIDKYGVMDKGATPARDVDLPRKVDDNTKVRRAARTEIESEIVTNKMAETMTEMIVKGDRRVTYRPISNKKLVDNSRTKLNTVGYDEMARQWFAKYYSDSRITPQFISDAEILIVESQRRDDSKTYTDLLLALPEIGTEGGQVIQAYSMIKKLTGTDALSTLDAVIGKLQLIKNKVEKGKSSRITVPQEMKERYIQAKNRENQEAKAETDAIADEIAQDLSEQTGASESDIKDMLVFAWDYAMQIINSNGNVSVEDVIMSQDLKQQAMDGMKATRTELEDELSDIAEVLDGLIGQEEETQKLMSDIRKAENMVSKARERLDKLDSDMADAENELISLEAEQDELLQKLNDAKTNKRVLDSIKNRIELLKGRLEKARAKAIEYGNEIPKAQEEYRRAYGEYVDALAEIEKAKAFKTMSDKMKSQAQSAIKRADKWADKLLQAQQDYDSASVDLQSAIDKYTAAKEKRDALKEKTDSSEKSANVQMVAISKAIERIQNEMNAIYGFNKDGTPKVEVDIDSEMITKYGRAVLDEALGNGVQTESDKILEEIKDYVAEQLPSSLGDKVRAWRYFAMLANPRTHMRNMTSNAFMVPIKFIKDLVAIGAENTVGRLASKFKTQKGAVTRSRSLKGAFTRRDIYSYAKRDAIKLKNIIQGNGDTGNKITSTVNYKDIMGRRKTFKHGTWMSIIYNNPVARAMASAMEESNLKFFSGTGKVIKKAQNEGLLNVLTEGNSNLLEWEDWIFSKMHYTRALANYMVTNKYDMSSITEEQLDKARNFALLEAQKATFRDYSALASAINSLNKNKPLGFMVDTILPFRKTPTNILKRGIEYSPIGLVKAITAGLWDVGKGYKTVYEWCDDLAAGFTGSAIAAIGMLGFYKGFLVGPDDDENESIEQKLLGLQSYALKIGDYTYSIDWMSPSAMPLFIGFNFAKMFSDDIGEGDMWELISNVISAAPSMMGPLFDMSMLDGVTDMLTIAGSEKNGALAATKAVSSLFGSYVGQFVPTILKAYTKTVDNVYRQTYIDKNAKIKNGDVQYMLAGIYRAIPALNKKLIPAVDRHGMEKLNAVQFESDLASKAWRILQNFISPGYLNRIDANAVDKELIRLGNKLGEEAYNILPKTLNKYIAIDGERYHLNPEEYNKAQKAYGKTFYGKLDEIIGSDYYKSLSDKDKAELVAAVKTYSENKAKRTILPTYVPSKEKAYAFLDADGYKFILNEAAEEGKEWNIVGTVSSIIDKVLPYATFDMSNISVSNSFRDKLYEYAREVAKEADDTEYHTDKDWVNIVKEFTDEQKAGYFYAIGLQAGAPTKEEGKQAVYNASIDDSIKLLVTNESAYEKYITELADTGISAVAYAEYKSFYDSAKSDDGGKTKKEKVVEWLNEQPLSDEQKSALYRLNYKDTSSKGKSLLDGVKWSYIYDNRASDNYSAKVGQKIADTSKYNNTAAPGQCVWFARGRAKEKLGKTIPAIGNANQMYYNAKDSAKLDATKDNIKADILVSYKVGTSAAGQTAGHVIYIEAVDGDTVYYTEGGYGSNSGILKTTTKDKLLQGKSGSGSTIGTGIIGFIDVKKY